MNNNQTVDYLYKEYINNKKELISLRGRLKKLNTELEEAEKKDVVQLKMLKKAMKDFDVDESDYKLDEASIAIMVRQRNRSLNQPKIAEEAYKVLLERGAPIHIKELTEILLNERGIVSEAKDKIASVTTSLMRRPDILNKIGDGMWFVQIRRTKFPDDEEQEE